MERAAMTITVYSKPFCSQCERTKNMLNLKRIPYVEVDVTEDQAAYDKVKDFWGFNQVPVVDTGDDVWSGFRPERIEQIETDGS